jgi:DNA-binding transcriptional LysR family regulator
VLEAGEREESIEVTGPVSADDFAFVLPTLEAGLGVGILPLFIGERAASLERVLPRYRLFGAPLHVVMPSASFVPARVTIVRDFLVDHLSSALSA